MLTEFRTLGGVADNIGLKESTIGGKGVFPLDPAQPIRLHVPDRLLVPSADTVLDEQGQLVVNPQSAFAPPEKEFFNAYQAAFSYGLARQELWDRQQAYAELPAAVQEALRTAGAAPPDLFTPPSPERCRELFCGSRQIMYGDKSTLMPVMELVNHAARGVPYDIRPGAGIGIAGKFPGEICAVYQGVADSWIYALNWGFATPMPCANSLPMSCTFGGYQIMIGRRVIDFEKGNQFRLPKFTVQDRKLELSFLELGNQFRPRVPRSVFLRVLQAPGVTIPKLDELFDLIQDINRKRFIHLLRALDGVAGAVPAMLRRAILFQLEALSTYYGTRELA